MQQKLLKDLTVKDKFEGFLMVKSAEQKFTKDNKSYVDLNLADKSAEINGKNWDISAVAPETGSIIKVKAIIHDYKGKMQLKVEQMSLPSKEEMSDINMSCFIKCAPYNPDEMLNKVYSIINAFSNIELKQICQLIVEENQDKLLYYPAAKEMHHAERSGLLHHICNMLHVSSSMRKVYTWIKWDLVDAGIILHDICKIIEMDSNEFGIVNDYTLQGNLIGHLVLCVSKIQQAADKLNLSGETIILLQHMILSHHGIAEYGSPKAPMIPEALILSFIDDLDAKLYQFQTEMDKVNNGAFTDYIKSLQRKVYKPFYENLN